MAAGYFLPLVLTTDVSISLLELFVPLTGRLGHAPADVIVAGIVGVLTAIVLIGAAPALRRGGNLGVFRNALLAASLAAIVAVAIMGLGPDRYTATRPKRLFVEHVIDRTGAEPVTVIALTPMDAAGIEPIEPYLIAKGSDGSVSLALCFFFFILLCFHQFQHNLQR
jgi:hypothetical protein